MWFLLGKYTYKIKDSAIPFGCSDQFQFEIFSPVLLWVLLDLHHSLGPTVRDISMGLNGGWIWRAVF